MRNIRNKNKPPTADLVQSFIGTAFDIVKSVADALPAIRGLWEEIEESGGDLVTTPAMDIAIALAVVGLWDHKGGYNASTNSPDLDTSPSGIKIGDTYTVTVAGTFYAVALEIGDVIIADQDDPAASASWTIINKNIDDVAFASAAQGVLADTALQPEDIDTLAELNAIVGDATLGDAGDFATAAQGSTADTAIQPGDNISDLTNDSGFTNDQSDGEIEIAYNNQVTVVSQAEAEAGTDVTRRGWTAQRVGQAIAALAVGTPEGTAILSTGETGGSKFLREDGDNSSSWQAVPADPPDEGTAIKSTGETGAVKFLREDGDDSSSWQPIPVTLTTKGDLAGYDTDDERIPVGTPGQVLHSDPSEALGVKWDLPSLYNPAAKIFDGASDYYQKTSLSTSGNLITIVIRLKLDSFTGSGIDMRPIDVRGNTQARMLMVIYSSDHTDTERRNKALLLVQNSAGGFIGVGLTDVDIADGIEHTIMFSFDGNTPAMTLAVDGQNADDAGFSARKLVTGTLGTGATESMTVGADNAGSSKYDGEISYVGMIEAYLSNYEDFMNGPLPRELDEVTWSEWGAQPIAWNQYGELTDNKGSGGNFTEIGTILGGPIVPPNTKGDIVTYGSVEDRLPVGTNTHVLTADSTVPLGIKWAAAAVGGGGGMSALIKTANYTASADDLVYCGTDTAAFTVTLPASPNDLDKVSIWDGDNNAGINNITIDRNGNNIAGAAQDFVINVNGGRFDAVWDNGNSTWVYSYVLTLAQDYKSAIFRTITGTSDTIVEADNGKILIYTNASSIAVTLPDGLSIDLQFTVIQTGAGVPTVTPATDTVNGAGAGVAPSAQWKAAYFTQFASTEWLALI